jgi:hypothetical protein
VGARAGLDRHRISCPPPGFDLWTVHPIVNSVLAMLSQLIHFLFVTLLPSRLYLSVYKLLKALEYEAFGCM